MTLARRVITFTFLGCPTGVSARKLKRTVFSHCAASLKPEWHNLRHKIQSCMAHILLIYYNIISHWKLKRVHLAGRRLIEAKLPPQAKTVATYSLQIVITCNYYTRTASILRISSTCCSSPSQSYQDQHPNDISVPSSSVLFVTTLLFLLSQGRQEIMLDRPSSSKRNAYLDQCDAMQRRSGGGTQ